MNRCNVYIVQLNFCLLWQPFPLAHSMSVLPFTCGDITWFWLRQYVRSQVQNYMSQSPLQVLVVMWYFWPRKWKWKLLGGSSKKLFKKNSFPPVYRFCFSTSSCLKCWMYGIPCVTRRQQACMMLHWGLLVGKLERVCITDAVRSCLCQSQWLTSRHLVS